MVVNKLIWVDCAALSPWWHLGQCYYEQPCLVPWFCCILDLGCCLRPMLPPKNMRMYPVSGYHLSSCWCPSIVELALLLAWARWETALVAWHEIAGSPPRMYRKAGPIVEDRRQLAGWTTHLPPRLWSWALSWTIPTYTSPPTPWSARVLEGADTLVPKVKNIHN